MRFPSGIVLKTYHDLKFRRGCNLYLTSLVFVKSAPFCKLALTGIEENYKIAIRLYQCCQSKRSFQSLSLLLDSNLRLQFYVN